MSNQEHTNNQQPPKRNLTWLWIVLVDAALIGGYCYWQNTKPKKPETFDLPETWVDSVAREMDSARNAALDTIKYETNEVSNKTATNTSSHQSPSSYSYDDDDDEQNDDPEYREGGKYDPALYHTDYGKDQEERRRRYIDNDGFDDDDGYDEYRGYEHENERSAQWDD